MTKNNFDSIVDNTESFLTISDDEISDLKDQFKGGQITRFENSTNIGTFVNSVTGKRYDTNVGYIVKTEDGTKIIPAMPNNASEKTMVIDKTKMTLSDWNNLATEWSGKYSGKYVTITTDDNQTIGAYCGAVLTSDNTDDSYGKPWIVLNDSPDDSKTTVVSIDQVKNIEIDEK